MLETEHLKTCANFWKHLAYGKAIADDDLNAALTDASVEFDILCSTFMSTKEINRFTNELKEIQRLNENIKGRC